MLRTTIAAALSAAAGAVAAAYNKRGAWTAETAAETVSVVRSFPAIRQDDSFRPILGVHPGNVG